jgi:transcriptional regulator with XRE-family HTH domain
MQLNRHALTAIRERSGLSKTALAQRAGISQPHLSNLELGRRQASDPVIVKLAGALGVPLPSLLLEATDQAEVTPGGTDETGEADLPDRAPTTDPIDDLARRRARRLRRVA